MHRVGLPLSGSVLSSPIRPSRENQPAHIPMKRGGARAVGVPGRGRVRSGGGREE